MILYILLILSIISIYLQTGQTIKIEYLAPIESNTIHLFWTGGYDSTFRLCQIILDEHKKVQPIYVNTLSTDGYYWLGSKIKRKNVNFEKKAMDKIRNYLYKNYPISTKLLLNTIYITEINEDPNYNIAMKNIYFKKFGILAPILNQPFGYFSRPYNQYTALSHYSKNYKYPIEIGVEKSNTGFSLFTKKYRIGQGHNCKLIPNKSNDLKIFDKIRFSIIHLTKKNMLEIAEKNNYDKVLKLSWSCWFPKNGYPCGNCDMCSHRLI